MEIQFKYFTSTFLFCCCLLLLYVAVDAATATLLLLLVANTLRFHCYFDANTSRFTFRRIDIVADAFQIALSPSAISLS